MAAVLEAFTGEHEDYFVDRCFEIACDERAPFIVLGGLPPTVSADCSRWPDLQQRFI
jgi:hypothetical protein